MDMGKFLEMGFTRSRRYANHSSGRKYTEDGAIRFPTGRCTLQCQEICKSIQRRRDRVAYDPEYQDMRKEWRASE